MSLPARPSAKQQPEAWVFLGGKMGDGGISPKNALMGVIGGWGYFKRDGGISNQEDTMVFAAKVTAISHDGKRDFLWCF